MDQSELGNLWAGIGTLTYMIGSCIIYFAREYGQNYLYQNEAVVKWDHDWKHQLKLFDDLLFLKVPKVRSPFYATDLYLYPSDLFPGYKKWPVT